MNQHPIIERLESLKRSYEAARDTEHTEASASIQQYLEGLNAGLQVAIDAIDLELRLIRAGQIAAARLTT